MPSLATPDQIAPVLAKLTLEQKAAQLTGMLVTDLWGPPTREGERIGLRTDALQTLRPHGLGHLSMSWLLGHDAGSLRDQVQRIQNAVRSVSPMGIGALVHNEGLNGFLHPSGSQFPTAWAQAATWAPALVERGAQVTAAHMQDAAMHLVFSPVMDINRDPRWGRVHETYGEDPELSAQFSVAFVRGIQGRNGDNAILATGKHFLGYGASEGGLNQALSALTTRTLLDEYAVPFRRAIAEAGLSVVMNSYNEIDGVPVAANRHILTEMLRDNLGFTGLTVADYDAVQMLHSVYHTAADETQAAVQALSAGLDVELPGDANYRHLPDAVRAGLIDEKILDQAVRRVLHAKAAAGLIPAVRPAPRRPLPVDSATASTVRQQIADRAAVLLSNKGVLPLQAGTTALVVGPAAEELRIHFGAYTSVANVEMMLGSSALRAGQIPGLDPETFIFTDIFQARMPGIDPLFETAATELHPEAISILHAIRAYSPDCHSLTIGSFTDDPIDTVALQQAAADVDVLIVAVGERTGWVGNNTAGEGQSTADPVLPGNQRRLIAAAHATGKKVVTVVVSGRPLILEEEAQLSDAVLLAPLLGEEGGRVIADVLFGKVNPSGCLPSTFPRTTGQIPIYHGHHFGSGYDHPTGTRHGYGDLPDQRPLYPFGHGLSYTTHTLGPLNAELTGDASAVTVTVTITNSGDLPGEKVLQLYARDEVAAIVRPARQLVDFTRIHLDAGQQDEVVFTIPLERLCYTGIDGTRQLEAGAVTFLAGFSSGDIRAEYTIQVPNYRPETPTA